MYIWQELRVFECKVSITLEARLALNLPVNKDKRQLAVKKK
jgi:hypothetical protein